MVSAMFRFLFFILIIYFGVKVLKGLLKPSSPPRQPNISPKAPPKKSFDFLQSDVEDAKFEDLDDKKN
jgi:hypothetical protein